MSQHDATPPVGGVILGMGGTFNVPERGFDGWSLNTKIESDKWDWFTFLDGDSTILLYAAPEGSEVVGMNSCSMEFANDLASIFAGTHRQENTPESETPDGFGPDTHRVNQMVMECKDWPLGDQFDHATRLARQLERENRRLRGRLEKFIKSWELEAEYLRSVADDSEADQIGNMLRELEEALAGSEQER